MLEECKGPQNSYVASDEEGYDPEKENQSNIIKYEE